MSRLVRSDVASGVATITLDSPANRNALSLPLVEQLHASLYEALDDDAVRAIVLTNTGPAFCAGADLKEQRLPMTDEQRARGPQLTVEIMAALWESAKPVVGRIAGHVRGGGLGFVGGCDIVLARDDVTFAFPEVRLGVVPAVIAVTVVPRLQPRAASELLLTGVSIDAPRAAAVGLITRAVAGEDLDTEVERCCDALRLGGPQALAATKQVIRRVGQVPLREAFDEMRRLSLERFASSEAAEGLAAAAQKRRPEWVGGQP